MLESSNPIGRRSQRPLPRQAVSPSAQPRQSRPKEIGSHRADSRSGLQRLLASLLGAGASKRKVSRREQLRQRRELTASKGESSLRSRSTPAMQPTPGRARVVSIDSGRSESARTQVVHARSDSQPMMEEPAPRIRRTLKSANRNGRPGASRPGVAASETIHRTGAKPQRGKPSHSGFSSKPRRSFSMSAFTQGMRLVILGVGVWAIVGTALSVWDPATRSSQVSQAAAEGGSPEEIQSSENTNISHSMSQLQLGQEMSSLGARIAPLTQAMSDLMPGVFVMDLDSGDYLSLNGEATFPAASMIKVPILVAFFQDIDAGKMRLDEVLTLQQADRASGSGEMQYAEAGTQYTALETVTNMIINSDNTATNMVMRRLGGIESLNQRFRQWGLQQTVMHNLLPDLEGTNTLSPKELSTLIARVSQGDLVSIKSRDRLFNIMQRTVNNSLLPSALGEGATIAHKTGDIGSLAGDAGLVDMPSGKRYAISVMVKRPHNDPRAYELVVQIGGAVYEYLSQSATSPAMTLSNPVSYPSTPAPAVSPAVSPTTGIDTSR